MKSIKEMAVSYGKEHLGTVNIEVFEAGANAVLDEIIDCLPKTSAYNPNEVIDIIISKIKQLKEK